MMEPADEIRELRKSLLGMIEHCEELNLILAEMVTRFGDPQMLDIEMEKPSQFTLRDVCLRYEKTIREMREKWDMPKVVQ